MDCDYGAYPPLWLATTDAVMYGEPPGGERGPVLEGQTSWPISIELLQRLNAWAREWEAGQKSVSDRALSCGRTKRNTTGDFAGRNLPSNSRGRQSWKDRCAFAEDETRPST